MDLTGPTVPPQRHLRGQDPEGAKWLDRAQAADEVRAGDQPQDPSGVGPKILESVALQADEVINR